MTTAHRHDDSPQRLVPIIIADIYELAGRLRDNGEMIARSVGQTQARWQVLSAASGRPQTVPQIARVLGVTRQNVQRIANLLVGEGRAEFRDNPDHQNSPYLVLTERGCTALEGLTKAAEGYHRRLARNLSDSEVLAVQRALRRLLEALGGAEPINSNRTQPNRTQPK